MWECLGGWGLSKRLLEGRERKQAYTEEAFIEVLSAAASKSLIHFKKTSGRFSLPCRECFLISDVVRTVGLMFSQPVVQVHQELLEKSI